MTKFKGGGRTQILLPFFIFTENNKNNTAMLKIKPEMFGSKTWSPTLNAQVKVTPEFVQMFANEGRTDLVEDLPVANKLVALDGRSLKELKEMAKGRKGFKASMDREQLIALLNAVPVA